MSPCDYDLFAKMKEPLRGTRYNTREEIIRVVERSLLDINRSGRAVVYDAFHKFGRRWYTWGANILKECVFTSGNKVIAEL
jgi:hypothetical protein